jgi:hypothetical protein
MKPLAVLFLGLIAATPLQAQSPSLILEIAFAQGNTSLSEEHYKQLGRLNQQFYLSKKVFVEGRYASSNPRKGLSLAEAQVESVRRWLREEGLSDERLELKTTATDKKTGVFLSVIEMVEVKQDLPEMAEPDTDVVAKSGLRLRMKTKESHLADLVELRRIDQSEQAPILVNEAGKNMVSAEVFEVVSRPEVSQVDVFLALPTEREWGRMMPYVYDDLMGTWERSPAQKAKIGKQAFLRTPLPEQGMLALMAPMKGSPRKLNLKLEPQAAVLSGRLWMEKPMAMQAGQCSIDQRSISFQLPEQSHIQGCSLEIVDAKGEPQLVNADWLLAQLRKQSRRQSKEIAIQIGRKNLSPAPRSTQNQ